MTNNVDNKKEWFAKARVDYFSPFLTLWLACNSWYKFHYATLSKDREHINKLKSDNSKQNVLFTKFKSTIEGGGSKEQVRLRANMELLHFSLSRADIQPQNFKYSLSFMNIPIDFSKKELLESYINIIINKAKKQNGKLKDTFIDSAIDLGEIVISSDLKIVFAGLIEIVYQVRCMLVHGELKPTDDNHEVVKYCYLILHDLMKDFCN